MKHIIRSKNFFLIFLLDAILVVGSFYFSYLIRFEFSIPESHLYAFKHTFPFVLLVKMCTFLFFQLYRGMWRYTSLVDLVNVGKAVFTSSVLIVLAVLMVHRFQGFARSVFIIDGFLTFMAIGGIRVSIRLCFARNMEIKGFSAIRRIKFEGKRLLIIGAGDTGEMVLREIQADPKFKFVCVGFLDDDPKKLGKTIHGAPILGAVDQIEQVGVKFDEILIAIPSAKGEEMRRIVAACEKSGKRYRTVPRIGELISGTISIKTIREITLEDLLGREEVHLDQEKICSYLHQKRILVTGAGGSIGSELVRQVSHFYPQSLALLDLSELNLFRIEMECRQRFGHVSATGYLADIRDRRLVERIFTEYNPQVVFHGAAYKHVPMQEINPWEAVFTNILGTRNLVEASLKWQVERFVLVSTDKAVRPVSVMGATKRVAELLVECCYGLTSTRLMAVRFGNVIGSSGSVLPIFEDQVARGGPVTVTHPEMTRYFMSVPEAAELIIQAGSMGEGGEIFILDMGKPIRIVDMARDLIRLHGFEPELDISIQFTGIRPGEKLYEELITEGEGIVASAHEKIMVLHGNSCELKSLNAHIDELLTLARTYDAAAIKRKLNEIVPEYTPQF